jgi:hypothetical protein
MSFTPQIIELADGLKCVLLEEYKKLERERDEAQKELSSIHGWIERNHPDGFIDSLTYFQNLERVADNWYERYDRLEVDANRFEKERDEAKQRLKEIEEYGIEEINAAVDLRRNLAQALVDLDDMQYQRDFSRRNHALAVESMSAWKEQAEKAERERDEARAERDSLRIDAQREAENHDRMVGELEGLYEQIEAMNKRLREP